MSYFQATLPGKWILAGEHSVTVGKPAIVFPLVSKNLKIEYFAEPTPIKIISTPKICEAATMALQAVMDINDLQGRMHITSTIDVSAGLGSSAALCAALALWLVEQSKLKFSEVHGIATKMEDVFHGKSSGLDLAAVLSQTPLYYQNGKSVQQFQPKWQPKIYLADTKIRSSTKECVNSVNLVRKHKPELDADMELACKKAFQALHGTETDGFALLCEAMDIAQNCFREWGLVPDSIENQIKELAAKGAQAIKLTGSGNGGFLVSLWKDDPAEAASDFVWGF